MQAQCNTRLDLALPRGDLPLRRINIWFRDGVFRPCEHSSGYTDRAGDQRSARFPEGCLCS